MAKYLAKVTDSRIRTMENLENCFYRVSVKALVFNEARDKFLICHEKKGVWDIPGGGLDWGVAPQKDLQREIDEEMGLRARWIAETPSYFLTGRTLNRGVPVATAVYETELESLDFTPSDECTEVKFVGTREDVAGLKLFPTIPKLIDKLTSQ